MKGKIALGRIVLGIVIWLFCPALIVLLIWAILMARCAPEVEAPRVSEHICTVYSVSHYGGDSYTEKSITSDGGIIITRKFDPPEQYYHVTVDSNSKGAWFHKIFDLTTKEEADQYKKGDIVIVRTTNLKIRTVFSPFEPSGHREYSADKWELMKPKYIKEG